MCDLGYPMSFEIHSTRIKATKMLFTGSAYVRYQEVQVIHELENKRLLLFRPLGICHKTWFKNFLLPWKLICIERKMVK